MLYSPYSKDNRHIGKLCKTQQPLTKDDPLSSTVVAARESTKSFLTRRVPNGEFDAVVL